MLWDKIVNPETGKSVSITSNVGIKVLNNYAKLIGGASKESLTLRQKLLNHQFIKLLITQKKFTREQINQKTDAQLKVLIKNVANLIKKKQRSTDEDKSASDEVSRGTEANTAARISNRRRRVAKVVGDDSSNKAKGKRINWDDFRRSNCSRGISNDDCDQRMQEACEVPMYKGEAGYFEHCNEKNMCSTWKGRLTKSGAPRASSNQWCGCSNPARLPENRQEVCRSGVSSSSGIDIPVTMEDLCNKASEPVRSADTKSGDGNDILADINDQLKSLRLKGFPELGFPHENGEVTNSHIYYGYLSLYMGLMQRGFNFLSQDLSDHNEIVRTGAPRLREGDIVWVNRNLISKVTGGTYPSKADLSSDNRYFTTKNLVTGPVQRWWRGTVVSPLGRQFVSAEEKRHIDDENPDEPKTVVWQENPGLNDWKVSIKFDSNPLDENDEPISSVDGIEYSTTVTYNINVATGALTRDEPLEDELKSLFRVCSEGSDKFRKPLTREKYTLALDKETYDENNKLLALGVFHFGCRTLKSGGEVALKAAKAMMEKADEIVTTENLKAFLSSAMHVCALIANGTKSGVYQVLNGINAAGAELNAMRQWREFQATWKQVVSSDDSNRCETFETCCKPYMKIFMYELGEMARGVHNLAYIDCRENLGKWNDFTQDSHCHVDPLERETQISKLNDGDQLKDWFNTFKDSNEGKTMAQFYNDETEAGIIAGVCSRKNLAEFTRELMRVRCPVIEEDENGRVIRTGESLRSRVCPNWIEYATKQEWNLVLVNVKNMVLFLKTCMKFFGKDVSKTFDDPYVANLLSSLGFPNTLPYHQCVAGNVRTFASCINYFDKLVTEINDKRNTDKMTNLIERYENASSADMNWVINDDTWNTISNATLLQGKKNNDLQGNQILREEVMRYIKWKHAEDECRYDDGTNDVQGGSCDRGLEEEILRVEDQMQIIAHQQNLNDGRGEQKVAEGGGKRYRTKVVKVGLSVNKVVNMIQNGGLVDNIY